MKRQAARASRADRGGDVVASLANATAAGKRSTAPFQPARAWSYVGVGRLDDAADEAVGAQRGRERRRWRWGGGVHARDDRAARPPRHSGVPPNCDPYFASRQWESPAGAGLSVAGR